MTTPPYTACVYCLTAIPSDLITVDHIIARSWYPTNAAHLPKWKAPACFVCNNQLSRIEDEVLCRLALCANPKDKSLERIISSVRRSLDPAYGKSLRDKMMRRKRRAAILRDLENDVSPTTKGMLPSFLRNFREGSRTGVSFKAKSLEAIGTKWIKGLHYWTYGDLIPSSAAIDIHFVSDAAAKEAFAEILPYATKLNTGPGIQALIFDAAEGNTRMTQYAFRIWREFTLYGTVEISL